MTNAPEGTLSAFLLARIAEDEEWAKATASPDYSEPHDVGAPGHHARVLAECEAKRRIVEHCEYDYLALSPGDPYVLQLLALPYCDHPDYRDEWRP